MMLKRFEALLQSCETVMPLTKLYDEGWMLRLTVDMFESIELKDEPHPLAVPPKCRWYSEALLPSAFPPHFRGDPHGEGWTHADGVIGHFDIGNGAKGNLTLHSDARHFVVIEAKMFSKLSKGVNNAPYFNQAARSVACIAEVLCRARRQVQEFKALGFYVLAPESHPDHSLIKEHLTKASLGTVVEQRVKEYGDKDDVWFSKWFLPVLDRLDIRQISWEETNYFLASRHPDADQLKEFYTRCLKVNRPPEKANKELHRTISASGDDLAGQGSST